MPTDRGFQWLVDLPDDLLVEPEEEPSDELQALRAMNSLLKERLAAADQELAAKMVAFLAPGVNLVFLRSLLYSAA